MLIAILVLAVVILLVLIVGFTMILEHLDALSIRVTQLDTIHAKTDALKDSVHHWATRTHYGSAGPVK